MVIHMNIKNVNKFLIVMAAIVIGASVTVYASEGIFNFTNKSETPKNIQVLGIEDKKDYSQICKQYNLSEVNEVPSDLNIQQNIGYQNNKFGLYIYRVDDFAITAANMVNTNGGDWGYVLVPINVRDYDTGKWNSFFNILNEYHLIPILQLWDESTDPVDQKKEIKKLAQFLNSLNWPIKHRYISVYNEVNDERFWKAGIDPKGYANLLNYTIDSFKEENKDFFMLNGAFNASALTGRGYLSADVYMEQMNNEVPGIFSKLDGWASHPYPHINGYLGLPTDTGRDSIKAYEWELQVLKDKFGVTDLPVFITETGWPHAEGQNYNGNYVSEEVAAQYLVDAFNNVWLPDERVVAVTPFTIKYDPPFDHFSFINKEGNPNKKYIALQNIKKTAGYPPVNKLFDPLKEKCLQISQKN